MAAIPPAGAPGAKPAEAPPERKRDPFQDLDLERIGKEFDKVFKYGSLQGFSRPFGKKEKLNAAGEFDMSGSHSNLVAEADAMKKEAGSEPKGTPTRTLIEAKAGVKGAVGRAQVAMAKSGLFSSGTSPDTALYNNSKPIIVALEGLAKIAYDPDTKKFMRTIVDDLKTMSPRTIAYYKKRFDNVEKAAAEKPKPAQAA